MAAAMAMAPSSSVDVQTTADASPSKPSSASDAAPASPAVSASPPEASPDRFGSSNSSPAEIQPATALKSEEYRQLFRLPLEEVLVEDFNCACQENILVQGHMYLFVHYICFYSNIFGFETKKVIHFRDITSVKRAKTAGIFPTAIEICTGDKKHLFASFLSRDEAFKLIMDGWVQHGDGAKALMEKQDSSSESSFRGNGFESDEIKGSDVEDGADACNRSEDYVQQIRSEDSAAPEEPKRLPKTEYDNTSSAVPEFQDSVEPTAESVVTSESPTPARTWAWKPEDCDAPSIPDCYTKVAEKAFPITVEEFFNFFFSDNAANFVELFHKKCGDKEFMCSPWLPHDQFGHTRNVSFQHPIKIYLGAKFGSCQEMQKFKVYRNSHLVIETSQEISDVPYGDHFGVEGLWDVRRDSHDCCLMSVYVNVAFLKRTMFKGQIVRSTMEECREAYAIWIDMAHKLLRKKHLEQKKDKEDGIPDMSLDSNGEAELEREANPENPPDASSGADDNSSVQQLSDSTRPGPTPNRTDNFQGNRVGTSASSITVPILRGTMAKLWSYMKSQTGIPPLLAISFAVILLMQLSIVVLLIRPQNIQVISQVDYTGGIGSGIGERSLEAVAWLEKRIHDLKEEMTIVESRLERMQREHARLKEQLKDTQQFTKHR